MGGWPAGLTENITNSAPTKVGAGAGAELGKNCILITYDKAEFEITLFNKSIVTVLFLVSFMILLIRVKSSFN